MDEKIIVPLMVATVSESVATRVTLHNSKSDPDCQAVILKFIGESGNQFKMTDWTLIVSSFHCKVQWRLRLHISVVRTAPNIKHRLIRVFFFFSPAARWITPRASRYRAVQNPSLNLPPAPWPQKFRDLKASLMPTIQYRGSIVVCETPRHCYGIVGSQW